MSSVRDNTMSTSVTSFVDLYWETFNADLYLTRYLGHVHRAELNSGCALSFEYVLPAVRIWSYDVLVSNNIISITY